MSGTATSGTAMSGTTFLATFFSEGTLGTPAAFAAAGLIGLLFGFWLERAGFGSSRRLTDVFYFRDFAVVQVMFSAILTAAIGLRLLVVTGAVDIASVNHLETFLGPQAVGGLIFGAGFVVGGWCPGTAMVGLASGKLDAAAFLGGSVLGSLAFAAAWPALADFSHVGERGVATLPELLGLSPGLTVLALVLFALAFFAVGARLVARFGRAPVATGEAR